MARRVIGYRGGTPIYRDEGPARGRVGGPAYDALSRLGAATLPGRLLPSMGAGEPGGGGAIERRQATAAQRATWAAERATQTASAKFTPSAEHLEAGRLRGRAAAAAIAASRARGAVAGGFTPGAVKPYQMSPMSRETGGRTEVGRTVTGASSPRPQPDVGSTALNESGRSRGSGNAPEPRPIASAPSGEVPAGIRVAHRTQPVTPSPLEGGSVSNDGAKYADSIPGDDGPAIVAPCKDCAHAEVCRIRPTLVAGEIISFTKLDGGGGVRIASISIDCDYFLELPLIERARRLSPVDRLFEGREGVTWAAPDDVPATSAGEAPRAAAPPQRVTGVQVVGSPMPPWQRRVLDTLAATKGDRGAAAHQLGQTRDSFNTSLSKIRRRDDLTLAERALVAMLRRPAS